MASEGLQAVLINAERGPCAVCFKPGLPCSQCRVDYYCHREEHRQRDSERHSKGCGVLRLCTSEKLGRYVEATEDIPKGTFVMRELPLVMYARPQLQPGQMLCVVCGLELPENRARWKQCKTCGWPVCDGQCAAQAQHQDECKAFKRAGFKVSKASLTEIDSDWLEALAALRTCLASDKIPQLRELKGAVEGAPQHGLSDSLQKRLVELAEGQKLRFKKAVDWLHNVAGVSWIPAEKLLHALAINHSNSVVDDSTVGGSRRLSRRSLYAGVAMLEHNCLPNTYSVLEDHLTGRRLTMVSTDVKKGEHLSRDYQNLPFRGRDERLDDSCRHGFICHCKLCEDPTDLGLFLGSPCCMKCAGQGKQCYVVNGKCTDCGEVQSPKVLTPAKEAFSRLLALKPNLRRWVRYPDEFLWPRGPLHDTHYLVLRAKMKTVAQLERSQMGYSLNSKGLGEPDDGELKCWEALCLDVLRVLEKLRPGANSHRQSVLLALYHVVGLQSFNALRRTSWRMQPHQTPTARQMVLVYKELETMMVAGDYKDELDEMKETWRSTLELPDWKLQAFLSGEAEQHVAQYLELQNAVAGFLERFGNL